MEGLLVGLAVLAAIGIGIGIAWAVVRHRYVKSLTDRGWQFINTPAISIVHGLNLPPFGLGDNRRVDDQIIGTTGSGVPFQALEYQSTMFDDAGYVVSMKLPHSMPEFYAFPPSRQRPAIRALQIESSPWVVVADDPSFAHAVMDAARGPLKALADAGFVPDISIDHDQLVALGVPKAAERLESFLDMLAALALALRDRRYTSFHGEPPPPELSVYGHSEWVYRTRDDSALQRVRHSGGGQNHRAVNVVYGHDPVLPFVSLTHLWETTRTETSTDADGHTQTRIVTDQHAEQVCDFQPQFRFRPFKVNMGLMGDRVSFEWSDFNDAFTVRCADPRFASDVFHPRQLEYLMRTRPWPFQLDESGRIRVDMPGTDPAVMVGAQDWLRGFFARVPHFVWEDLGYQNPPLPLHDYRSDPQSGSRVTA